MIDIHTHILPGMDDGSVSIEESIGMARMAAESGVSILVATPHCNLPGVFDNYDSSNFENILINLRKALQKEQIPIEILPGMEVYGTEEVPNLLRKGRLITLNYSRYLLMEFSFREDLLLTEYLIHEVKDLGYLPIIAHPERYPYVQKHPGIVYDWIQQGCLVQLNKGSILGSFGTRTRNTAIALLECNLVSVIASDAHSSARRTTDLTMILEFIENNFSKEYAEILLAENPRRVIENTDLIVPYNTCQARYI